MSLKATKATAKEYFPFADWFGSEKENKAFTKPTGFRRAVMQARVPVPTGLMRRKQPT